MLRLRLIVVLAAALLCATAGTARAQAAASCTSSIRVLFNRYGTTQIPTGSTIWFSSVLEGIQSEGVDLAKTPVRIDVRQSRITFGRWPYVIAMPDSTISLDPSSGEPQRWWEGERSWSLTYTAAQVPEAFFDGMPFTAPAPFVPASSGPVTWTATFTASRPGITVRWAWSAAVYSKFGVNGWLLVKPFTAPVLQFQNSDPAGTPELFKQYVVAGAMGTGTPQYTGARSDTASVSACVASSPPLPTPMQAATPGPGLHSLTRIGGPFPVAPPFASPVSQHINFGDGSAGAAVDRCYATDLCALISYGNGDRLEIYSEGAARCKPYVLYFNRSSGLRTIFGFSRDVERDRLPGTGGRCPTTRTTHIVMDGGRVVLTISKNTDGTLRFRFAQP